MNGYNSGWAHAANPGLMNYGPPPWMAQPMNPTFSHGGAAMPPSSPSGMYDPHGNRMPGNGMGGNPKMGPPAPYTMGQPIYGPSRGMDGGMNPKMGGGGAPSPGWYQQPNYPNAGTGFHQFLDALRVGQVPAAPSPSIGTSAQSLGPPPGLPPAPAAGGSYARFVNAGGPR